MQENILKAIEQAEQLTKGTASINLKGKKYLMVKDRINIFRKMFGFDYGMTTEILVNTPERIVMKATITNKDGFVIANGHAEEVRNSGVNIASAIENGESSAWGRCLANLGLHGTEIASADELNAALEKNIKINNEIEQKQKAVKKDPPEKKQVQKINDKFVSYEDAGSLTYDQWIKGKYDQVTKDLYHVEDFNKWHYENYKTGIHLYKAGNEKQKVMIETIFKNFKTFKQNVVQQGRNK